MRITIFWRLQGSSFQYRKGLHKVGTYAFIIYKQNPNSNAKRKEDGRDEARIIELAGAQPPNGRTRWNLRLLEEKLRVALDTPIGKDAIRDI